MHWRAAGPCERQRAAPVPTSTCRPPPPTFGLWALPTVFFAASCQPAARARRQSLRLPNAQEKLGLLKLKEYTAVEF